LQKRGTWPTTLSTCAVRIDSLQRLTCPAFPAHFFSLKVFSTLGGACSGRSLDGSIEKLPELIPNRDAAPCSPSTPLPHASRWPPLEFRRTSTEQKFLHRHPQRECDFTQSLRRYFSNGCDVYGTVENPAKLSKSRFRAVNAYPRRAVPT
jgi:hypothetical protein